MEPVVRGDGGAGQPPAAAESRGPSEAPVVLLVDDDPPVLHIVGRYIARCGCRVVTAGSPAEALEKASSAGRVDLLVTDVKMPRMTGPELYLRLLREIPGLGVIYISGYPGAALQEHGVSGDGVLFLAKPFSAAEMAEKLREALGRPARSVLAPA